jgi:hypothetical protein
MEIDLDDYRSDPIRLWLSTETLPAPVTRPALLELSPDPPRKRRHQPASVLVQMAGYHFRLDPRQLALGLLGGDAS